MEEGRKDRKEARRRDGTKDAMNEDKNKGKKELNIEKII